MKTTHKQNRIAAAFVGALVVTSTFAADAPKMKMTTDIPSSITTPDKVETRLGTLKFTDGFPDDATVQKCFDNLDFQRAVQAYLLGQSANSTEAARNAILSFGPANQTVLISETLLDSKSLFLTANTTTPYSVLWLDLLKGPVVLEVPPMVLGPLDDAWFRWVVDVGMTGPDQGKGGKYLLLRRITRERFPKVTLSHVRTPTDNSFSSNFGSQSGLQFFGGSALKKSGAAPPDWFRRVELPQQKTTPPLSPCS